MFFHIILTTECNLHCRYCFGETIEDFDEDFGEFDVDYSLPKKAIYDTQVLCRQNKANYGCGKTTAFHDTNQWAVTGLVRAKIR